MKKFLTTLLLLVLFAPFAIRADEVIIGEGTDYDCSVPFNTLYTYSWNESIYPGAEIGGACTINSIAFNCNAHDTIGTLNLTELDVYMGITQRETMSSNIDWTPAADLSLVYSGTNVVIGDDAWETITLDSPFYFTGEGNLVVVVAKKTNFQYISELKWFYTSVDNTTLYRRNDSSESIADEHPGSASGTRLSYRPNIKLNYIPGEVESPVVINPETIDLGYRPIGAWMRPQNIEVTTSGDDAAISSISSSNPFFVYTPVEMPYELTTETPLTVKVSHLSGNDGAQTGELLINHSFGSDAVQLTATAYTPNVSDVWEMPMVVGEYPFVHTPDFDNLYDNYMLPGDEEDGKDVVYRLTLSEETTLSAKVNGANGKVALYETHFNGKGGPDFDNYYGTTADPDDPNDPTPDILGDSFSENFDDGSMEGWNTIDADGDFRNWKISQGNGVEGIDESKCIYSESYDSQSNSALTPDNYIVSDGLYTITENSTLSFYAKPLDTWSNYYLEHYGVAISYDGTNFITVWEHTVSSTELDWVHKTVDLSDYAGRNVYIALRHFDCSNRYAICIDNIELTSGNRSAKSSTIENLTVPAGVYYLVASATEKFTVSVITETEGGNNTVSEVVAEVVNDNSAKAYWSWDFINNRLAFKSGREIENPKNTKGFSNYKVYRKNIIGNNEAVLVANNVTDTVYVDNTWGTAQGGIYKYGVSVVYTDGETPIVWSNSIDKDMNVAVTINVETETGASANGAQVSFVNADDASYTYEVTLGNSGTHTWNDFRLGTYDYTVSLEGFKTSAATIDITEPTVIECVLEEVFAIGDFYVSPTGWAMWNDNAASFDVMLDGQNVAEVETNYYQYDVTNLVEGNEYTAKVVGNNTMEYIWTYSPCSNFVEVTEYSVELNGKDVELSWTLPVQGDGSYPSEFMFDFEDGTLNGFTTIDANADGNKWGNSTQFSQTDCGYESANSAVSRSYDGMYNFEPDDYLVTASKYAITEDSKLVFHVCAENSMYAAEHYGVAISEFSNVSPSAFTMIWEETLTAKEGENVDRDARAQGSWYQKTIDLSAYAGKDVYIALRHFDCYGQFWINIDNLTLTTNAKATADDGEWIHYDDDANLDAVGMNNGATMQWGIMFPAEDLVPYAGKEITKISMYDKTAHDGSISIYFGGNDAPANLVHTQAYVCTGAEDYAEFELSSAVDITGEDNIWIVFENNNGQFVASCCVGNGEPNGRWISFNGIEWSDVSEAVGMDITWQIRAYVEAPKEPNYTEYEVLGAMVYRNGELITEEPITEETFVDVNPGYDDFEYSVRAVFGGEENSYYAMSCPQTENISIVRTCPAPRNLHGIESVQNGEFGVALTWPYTLQGSEWLYYDDGNYSSGIGLNGGSFYWGVKFPVESLEYYGGTMMTKVAIFDSEAHTGNLLVYYGGDNAPEILAHTQPYEMTGVQDFVEVELTAPLPVDPSMNLWIVLNNDNGNYPAAGCATTGDPNGRWISLDGTTWQDVIYAGQGLDYTWMIRAFVTSEMKDVIELPREDVFQHYNVYRGTSNDNYELIAETEEGSYFDAVEIGTYYYKVTSVYIVDGEECESEGANAFGNENQRFVIVDVTSINENGVNDMMIYPNPANDFVKVSTVDSQQSTVRIYNTLGMLIEEIEMTSNEIEINISRYTQGIYFFNVETENGNVTKKVVKN